MKYVSVLIGLVLFSAFLYLMLGFTADMGEEYNSDDYSTYSTFSSKYNVIDEVALADNGTSRRMSDRLDDAGFESLGVGVAVAENAYDSTKLMKESFSTIGKITDYFSTDMDFIHPIISTIIKAIFTISLILMILFMFMRFKAET